MSTIYVPQVVGGGRASPVELEWFSLWYMEVSGCEVNKHGPDIRSECRITLVLMLDLVIMFGKAPLLRQSPTPARFHCSVQFIGIVSLTILVADEEKNTNISLIDVHVVGHFSFQVDFDVWGPGTTTSTGFLSPSRYLLPWDIPIGGIQYEISLLHAWLHVIHWFGINILSMDGENVFKYRQWDTTLRENMGHYWN
ncbi:hypothetical protein BDP27DRAFT_1404914 [Rhodocollybia butyracea]|uniref:Uncharacterized protein n=1 Tax=Rhodocollybia butyracea TaxID=206335 RepID=A0A9P5PNK8_9AGAR|nr:hypothetical protein BDP27DRAFT_1404914 [Rhodocollybia butyracea]